MVRQPLSLLLPALKLPLFAHPTALVELRTLPVQHIALIVFLFDQPPLRIEVLRQSVLLARRKVHLTAGAPGFVIDHRRAILLSTREHLAALQPPLFINLQLAIDQPPGMLLAAR
mgnify:CR=1 FL=1